MRFSSTSFAAVRSHKPFIALVCDEVQKIRYALLERVAALFELLGYGGLSRGKVVL